MLFMNIRQVLTQPWGEKKKEKRLLSPFPFIWHTYLIRYTGNATPPNLDNPLDHHGVMTMEWTVSITREASDRETESRELRRPVR